MRGAARKAAQLRALTRAEWRLIGEAGLLLPIAAIALRSTSLAAAVRMLRRGSVRRTSGLSADRASAIVNAAGLLMRAGCLTRSIVLHGALARRGIQAELVVGAARAAGGYRAHAWLERNGRVLAGSDAVGFTPLWRSSTTATHSV